MIARVSMAATDRRRGRCTSCAWAIASAHSRRVSIWKPSASSTPSIPCPPASYTPWSSLNPARTSSSVAPGSSPSNSSSVTGLAAANSAASSSLVSACTGYEDRAKAACLGQPQRPEARQLQQRDQHRDDIRDGGVLPQQLTQLHLLPLAQHLLDPARGPFRVQGPGHHPVHHPGRKQLDQTLGGQQQLIERHVDRRWRQLGGLRHQAAGE